MLITKRGVALGYLIAFLLWIPGITYTPMYPFWNIPDALHQWPWFIAGTSVAVWTYTKWAARQALEQHPHPYEVLKTEFADCVGCKAKSMRNFACPYDKGFCVDCCNCPKRAHS